MDTSTFPTLHKSLKPPFPSPQSQAQHQNPKITQQRQQQRSTAKSSCCCYCCWGIWLKIRVEGGQRQEPILMARFTGHGGVKLCLNGGDRASSFGCEMRDHIRFRVCNGRRRVVERSVGIHRSGSRDDHGSGARVWALGKKLSGFKGEDSVKDNAVVDEDSDDYDDVVEEEELDSEFDELSCFRGLVLDITYRPVNVVCWKRAICLEFTEKADVLEYYDQTVSSPQGSFYIPAVLRVPHLLQIVQRRRIKHILSRKSIFYRDSYTCQSQLVQSATQRRVRRL